MPKGKGWNTKEHDKWLTTRLADYKKSKNNKVLRKTFVDDLRRDWFQKYPVGEPSAELIEKNKIRPITSQQEKQHVIAVAQAKARGETPPPPPVAEVVDEKKAEAFAKAALVDGMMTVSQRS